MYNCNHCLNSYKAIKNLRRHVKNSHPREFEELAMLPKKKYSCCECAKQYNTVQFLRKHEKKEHNVEYARQHELYYCPICEYKDEKYSLIVHFNEQHQINIMETEYNFTTFEEFSNWKNKIESDTRSRFVIKGGCDAKRKTKFFYFTCNRSGAPVIKTQRKRNLKMQGCNKIRGLCPASMTVKCEQGGNVKVKYIQTHVGHKNDLGHLSLSGTDRIIIAQKIASGISFDSILDEVQDFVGEGELQRVHLVTKMDLDNIESSFKLNINIKKHENDAVSVDAWINELGDSVLFYKPQQTCSEQFPQLSKDDFVLIIMNEAQEEMLNKYGQDVICVDGTYGLNKYNFELITILVLDDLRQGFPCAFLITNRCDQIVLSVFFTCIRKKRILQPKVFMSDMANEFFNAFVEIMGLPSNRLFCTWHVDKAWRKNLTKIKDKNKQIEVYKILRTLLEETDKVAFEELLNSCLNILIQEPVTKDFGMYFINEYLNSVASWAYCYRLNCGINTNMHLERMHRTIEYVYFHGKNTKRLDKMLYVLMKFVRDRLYDRIITLHKGKITKKISDLRNPHKISQSLTYKEIIRDENGWNIQSSDGNKMYVVKQNLEECQCELSCQECNICIHMYSCSCIDYTIKWNMCKHIHFVCMILKTTDDQGHEPILAEDSKEVVEKELILKEIFKQKSENTCLSDEIDKLNSKWNCNIKNITNMNQIQAVNNHLKSMKVSIAALGKQNEIVSITDGIGEKQIKNYTPTQAFSTKKVVKKKSKLISKPTSKEREDISFLLSE